MGSPAKRRPERSEKGRVPMTCEGRPSEWGFLNGESIYAPEFIIFSSQHVKMRSVEKVL